MSSLPTREEFASRLHSAFAMHSGDSAPIELELVDVRSGPAAVPYESFSLMFRAPVDAPARQDSYRLEHPSLGAMEILLVPVKKDAAGLYFEAVFNYLPARA